MIRRLNHDDVWLIYDLLRPFFNEGHWHKYGAFSPENTVSYVSAMLSIDESHVMGYFKDDALVGIVSVEINLEFHDRPMAYFTNFYTSPTVRGAGVGRKLVEAALKVCQDTNCLNVYAANTGILSNRANKLLENLLAKYGFQPVSRIMMRVF